MAHVTKVPFFQTNLTYIGIKNRSFDPPVGEEFLILADIVSLLKPQCSTETREARNSCRLWL